MEALEMRIQSHFMPSAAWIFACAIALASAPAMATAIGNGLPGPDAGFSLTEIGAPSGTPADGFQISYVTQAAAASFSTIGSASASASLLPVISDGQTRLHIGTIMDVAATAPGEAIADVTQHILATVTNILDTPNSFNLVGAYGINTAIFVNDLLHESVFATWNVGLEFTTRPSFHEVRTVNCDLATFTPNACPNLFDNNSGSLAFVTLDPGESFDILLITDMSLHAVAVSEPATLALFGALCLVLAFLRHRLTR
jgi:hypothetical protein